MKIPLVSSGVSAVLDGATADNTRWAPALACARFGVPREPSMVFFQGTGSFEGGGAWEDIGSGVAHLKRYTPPPEAVRSLEVIGRSWSHCGAP